MIPALYKGSGITGAVRYVLGQGNDKETGKPKSLPEGEASRVAWTSGTGFGFELDTPERIDLARRIMEWSALPENQGSKTRKLEEDCIHLALSWREHEKPNREEMEEAARGALKAMGMETARALFVAHTDTDNAHVHIIASRINPATGRAFSDYKDFPKLEAWAERFDVEHGYEAVPGRVAKSELAELITARDTAKILERFTETRSTFEADELRRFLYKNADAAARRDSCKGLAAEIIAHSQVIGLKENREAPVTRYTTRDVLAAERQLMRDAVTLADNTSFGLPDWHLQTTLDRHSQLDVEQRQAVAHLTEGRGLALLAGEAGTGKSTTLAAVRDAYEQGGYRVIGMSWKNDVVQDMARDGFQHTTTIAAELLRLKHGKASWDSNTVLVVDEAAMLATKHLGALLKAAEEGGAKVILAGDERQLASIEAGGMFGQLQATHGAAELHSVRRVSDADQRRAFNLMHKGEFAPALSLFDQVGAVRWNDSLEAGRTALIAQYAADTAAQPDKKRFIFAHTNAEVGQINADVRAIRRERGELESDCLLRTADGPTVFAVNDRIAFTGNATTKQGKAAGLVNGNFGTITEIDGIRVTVQLDTKAGQQPREVSFTVGDDKQAGQFNSFRHGYAGTIFKGQGRTLDQTYVLHTDGMRDASSYVALTRHRESVAIFATRAQTPWMDEKAGAKALTADQLTAAKGSFDRWAEKNPRLADRRTFEGYVKFVQEKRAAENRPDYQLAQLANKMGRTDDRRAASRFVIDKPRITVTAAMQQAAKEAARPAPAPPPPAPTPAPIVQRVPAKPDADRAPIVVQEATRTAERVTVRRPVPPAPPTPPAVPAVTPAPVILRPTSPTPKDAPAKKPVDPSPQPATSSPKNVRQDPRADFDARQRQLSDELEAKKRTDANQTRQGPHNEARPTTTNPAATPEQAAREAREEKFRQFQASLARQAEQRRKNGRGGGRTRTRRP